MTEHSYETVLAEALAQLQVAQALLTQEITKYPTPISGCDAQFNHLLSDRKRISKATQALNDIPFIPTPRKLEAGATSECR